MIGGPIIIAKLPPLSSSPSSFPPRTKQLDHHRSQFPPTHLSRSVRDARRDFMTKPLPFPPWFSYYDDHQWSCSEIQLHDETSSSSSLVSSLRCWFSVWKWSLIMLRELHGKISKISSLSFLSCLHHHYHEQLFDNLFLSPLDDNWWLMMLLLRDRVAKTCQPCQPVGAIFSGRC